MLPVSRCKYLISGLPSSAPAINVLQKRTSFYNKYKHGPYAANNPPYPHWQWTKEFFAGDGIDFLKKQFKIKKNSFFKGKPTNIAPGKKIFHTYIFEDFDSDEAIARWKAVADSDSASGYSKINLSRSPEGHMLFTGFLDTRLPDDGVTQNTGFVGMIGPQKQALTYSQRYWDWEIWNTVEIKFRGDGRKYALVINTASRTSDINFYDAFSYPIYTKGGPYWQTIRIHFSKFLFNYKGFIQDDQYWLPFHRIKFVSIALSDRVCGPFRLEVDYIGLRQDTIGFDETSAYEQYRAPHVNYRQLQVDCLPPESVENRQLN